MRPPPFPISDETLAERTGRRERRFGIDRAEVGRLVDWARAAAPCFPDLASVGTFVMFIGYPRSGHSIVGALLDAHPEMAIAHELDVLRFRRGGLTRAEIMVLLAENSRRMARLGRRAGAYAYHVPGGAQGRWDRLSAIGDKMGGAATRYLATRESELDDFLAFLAMPVRFVHVVRHPLDNIASMAQRDRMPEGVDRIAGAIAIHRWLADRNADLLRRLGPGRATTIWHEDLVDDPRRVLGGLCRFIGVDAPAVYLDACAAIVAPAPRRTRSAVAWSDAQLRQVGEAVAAHPFLRRYAL
ncbi:MAG: sulfotransferase [Alphaproteobacteria bacterium]|nr:sulfotransferase [Alphaproteobacteria bacterium]